MSRAVRRQQQAAGKERQRPSLGVRTPRQTRGARPSEPQRRRGPRLGLPRWLGDIWSELKKVSWPSRDETIYLTTVVIIVSLIVGSFLGGVDAFFSWLIDQTLLR